MTVTDVLSKCQTCQITRQTSCQNTMSTMSMSENSVNVGQTTRQNVCQRTCQNICRKHARIYDRKTSRKWSIRKYVWKCVKNLISCQGGDHSKQNVFFQSVKNFLMLFCCWKILAYSAHKNDVWLCTISDSAPKLLERALSSLAECQKRKFTLVDHLCFQCLAGLLWVYSLLFYYVSLVNIEKKQLNFNSKLHFNILQLVVFIEHNPAWQTDCLDIPTRYSWHNWARDFGRCISRRFPYTLQEMLHGGLRLIRTL